MNKCHQQTVLHVSLVLCGWEAGKEKGPRGAIGLHFECGAFNHSATSPDQLLRGTPERRWLLVSRLRLATRSAAGASHKASAGAARRPTFAVGRDSGKPPGAQGLSRDNAGCSCLSAQSRVLRPQAGEARVSPDRGSKGRRGRPARQLQRQWPNALQTHQSAVGLIIVTWWGQLAWGGVDLRAGNVTESDRC